MTASEDAARAARRAAGLKDNLKRRKEQARARAGVEARGPQVVLEEGPEKGPNAAQKPG